MTSEAGNKNAYSVVSVYLMVGVADTQRASSAATLDSIASSSSSDSWLTEDSEVSPRGAGDNAAPIVGGLLVSVVETRNHQTTEGCGSLIM